MSICFEWDNAKNLSNQRKHKISFDTAQLVFDDPFALSGPERIEGDEERWQTIGKIGTTLIVLVAHTVRFVNDTEIIRIISARKTTAEERKRYEKQAY
jgi:uncharacterized protein